ncbi:MAG: TonB-dependent receptor [Comamonadaceae bacterium]
MKSTPFNPKKKVLFPVALAVALAFPCTQSVWAQTATLPSVTVTSSPVIDSNATDPFASFSTSVTGQQIQDLNAVDLASALRRTPGVTISRFNPVGSFGGEEGGAVYIRGMGSSRPGSEIKTYVDGVPFYMAVWNHPLLDLLPVNAMERIDVLKGPQPQVCGNTFGAINLVPKRAGKGDGVTGDAQLSAGSFGTVVEQFDLTGRSGDLDYSLAQGYAKSNGHRPDADGKLANLMGRAGYKFSPQWSVNLLLLSADNTAGDPGHATTLAGKGDQYNTRGSLVALTVVHDHDWIKGAFKAYANNGQAEQIPGFTSKFNMSGIRLREDISAWNGGKVLVGVDIDKLSGEVSPIGFDSEKLTLTSPYLAVSHTASIGSGWTITPSAGVRSYSHNLLGDSTAPHAGVVVHSAEQLALRANVSKGVNFPGLDAAVLSQLIPPLGASWKTLGAEKMDHKEIGLSWFPHNGTSIDVSVFSDHVIDRYVFAFPPAVSAPGFINLGTYDVHGSEISVQYQIGTGWRLFAGLTKLSSSKADLPYAPSSSVSLGVNWQGGAWRVSADVQNQSSMNVLGQARASGAPNPTKVEGFSVANVRAAFQLPALGRRGEVFVALENLFDQQYEFRAGYPMPGRSMQVGLHTSF